MDEYKDKYSRAFDCKHSTAVVNVMVKQRISSSVIIDVAAAKMTKLSESCPHYLKRPYGTVMPPDFCHNYCGRYEKRLEKEGDSDGKRSHEDESAPQE